jgi:hypothetical protein
MALVIVDGVVVEILGHVKAPGMMEVPHAPGGTWRMGQRVRYCASLA